MFSVLVIRLRSLRLLRVSGIVMRLRMFLLLITFLKASHSFRNRLLVICKNAYYKQMDNRIKLLEEILSFRMQGVEFDNGDMYVDGHKAASDVRDEFVSVTEKLMDELAQCYNVLP